MGKISCYRSLITMQLIDPKNNIINIPPESIQYIIIDSNFEEKMMPVIYITMKLTTDIFNQLIDYKNTGRIYLNIKQYDVNSPIALYKDRVKGQFIYFPPKDYDYRKSLSNNNPNVDNSYNKITIGLIDADILNFNTKSFNGVYNNIDTSALVKMITNGREFITDKLDTIEVYDRFFIPPMKTRSEAINYVFGETKFFAHQYLYFNDFNISYLLNRIDRKSATDNSAPINTILFFVSKLNVADSYYDGMEKALESRSYNMYLNTVNIEYVENDYSGKSTNKIIAVDESGVKSTSLNIKENKFIGEKVEYVRTDTGLDRIKNNYESSQLMISVTKNNLDGSIFAPNMVYRVSNYNDKAKQYDGNYTIIQKKEIISKANKVFNNTLQILLRKIPVEK